MPADGHTTESDRGRRFRIEPLSLEHVDGAAGVISEALVAEPVTGAMFDLSDPRTREAHKRAIALQMRKAVEAGEPPLVAVEAGRVVGVAIASRFGWRAMVRTARSWFRLIPRIRRSVWCLGSAAMPSRRVPRPYVLLDALGVAPDAEGRGIGSALLEGVIEACAADQKCSGVYLQTASDRARGVYERASFEVLEERSGAGLKVAHMFRRVRGD